MKNLKEETNEEKKKRRLRRERITRRKKKKILEIRGEKNNNVKVNIKSIEYKIIVDTVKVSKRLKKKRVILEIY